MNQISDRRTLAGVLLVVIGLVLLGAQWFELTGAAVLGALSAIFLVAYVGTRHYGWLVPGMILGGLAIGVGLQDYGYDPHGGFVVVGLGAGFIAIYLVDTLVRGGARWWPLIPGSILAVVGATQITEGTAAATAIARLWPVALVAAGVLMLVGAQRVRSPGEPKP